LLSTRPSSGTLDRRQAGRGRTDQAHALGGRDRRGGGQRVADQVGERDLLQGQAQRAGVDPGQLEQVVHHRSEPVGLLADAGVVAPYRVRVGGDAVLERLCHGPDARQRRAQVVAGPGDQLPAAGLERPLALAGLLQPHARLGQLPVQGGHLGVRRAGRAGVRRVAEVAGGEAERGVARHHGPPEQGGGHQPDRARDGDDDQQHAQVVRGQEHRARRTDRARHDGAERHDDDDGQGDDQTAGAHRPQDDRADERDRQRAAESDPYDDERLGRRHQAGPAGTAGSYR